MDSRPDPTKPPRIDSGPDEHSFYSNIAAVRATPEELIIHFGFREEEPNVGTGVAKAIMSLAHAKRLATAIASTVKHYEDMFGEVVIDELARIRPERREELLKAAKEASGEDA